MSKGSSRRPGNISQDAWNRIFHLDICPVCGELKAKCECMPTDDGPGQPGAAVEIEKKGTEDANAK